MKDSLGQKQTWLSKHHTGNLIAPSSDRSLEQQWLRKADCSVAFLNVKVTFVENLSRRGNNLMSSASEHGIPHKVAQKHWCPSREKRLFRAILNKIRTFILFFWHYLVAVWSELCIGFLDFCIPPSELLEICELSLDKMGAVFEDSNVYMLHMMYQAMGVCLYVQDWEGALRYGQKIIRPYR